MSLSVTKAGLRPSSGPMCRVCCAFHSPRSRSSWSGCPQDSWTGREENCSAGAGLVQGESRVVGQAAECRPQTQNVFPCFCARKTWELFYAYMSTPAMPGPCVWAPTPWRSLVQGESRVVGQAAECRPQTQNVFPCFCARKLLGNCFMPICLPGDTQAHFSNPPPPSPP